MKIFNSVEFLIRMIVAHVYLIIHIPITFIGFITANIIDAFQAGMDKSEDFCDWITKGQYNETPHQKTKTR